MEKMGIILLICAGAILPMLLGHAKRVGRKDPFFQWFHGGGKLLPDYDAEEKQIDQWMR